MKKWGVLSLSPRRRSDQKSSRGKEQETKPTLAWKGAVARKNKRGRGSRSGKKGRPRICRQSGRGGYSGQEPKKEHLGEVQREVWATEACKQDTSYPIKTGLERRVDHPESAWGIYRGSNLGEFERERSLEAVVPV